MQEGRLAVQTLSGVTSVRIAPGTGSHFHFDSELSRQDIRSHPSGRVSERGALQSTHTYRLSVFFLLLNLIPIRVTWGFGERSAGLEEIIIITLA